MKSQAQQRIAVVTDSTSDLPADVAQANGITVVPLTVIMGDKHWLDQVELAPSEFYQLLQTSSDHPSTSQPSAGAFLEVFEALAKTHEGIVAVLVSKDLSGTMASAQAAATKFSAVPLEIVDSRGVTGSLGLIALAAARAAAAGGDLQAVADAARSLVEKTHIYFMVDTLEYLHRGGRIGTASKLLGSALNLKPILSIQKGVLVPAGRVRTRRKALAAMQEMVADQLMPGAAVHMAVFNAAAGQQAASFRQEVEARFQPVEIVELEIGPVVGTHAGPGTIGVAFFSE